MSVVAGKRTDGELKVLTKATELADHTLSLCSNSKHFPARYNLCFNNKMIDDAISICALINEANDVKISSDVPDLADAITRRYSLQSQALEKTYSLQARLDIAYRKFKLNADSVHYWTGLIIEVRNKLRNWRKSDMERCDKGTSL